MIIPNGFSSELKDRRVDSLLLKNGFSFNEIYYSPIKIWAIFYFLFLLAAFPFSIILIPIIFSKYKVFLILYIVSAYLVAAFLNNSFTISNGKLIVVNPNPPFRKIKEYSISKIHHISIKSNPWLLTAWLFGPLGSNYVELNFLETKKRFYCAGLDIDAYDENFTKLTLDDLHKDLIENGVKVEFGFD